MTKNNNPILDEESLKQEFDPILKKIDKKEDREEALKIIAGSMSFEGPLPPPSVLKRYGQMIENGEERIMRMAELQHEHRISIEKYAIKEEFKQSKLGQIFAFILGVMGILGGISLAITGHEEVACTLIIATIGSLAVAFVKARDQQTKEEIKASNDDK